MSSYMFVDFLICTYVFLHSHIKVVVAFLVVNLFGFLAIAFYHNMRSGRKFDTWKLPASRTFLSPKGSKNQPGKPKIRDFNFEKKSENLTTTFFWAYVSYSPYFFYFFSAAAQVDTNAEPSAVGRPPSETWRAVGTASCAGFPITVTSWPREGYSLKTYKNIHSGRSVVC